MNDGLSTAPRLRVVASGAPRAEIPDRGKPKPLRPDWLRLLREITGCGVLRLQIGNDGARLHAMAELWSAEARGPAVWLAGPGMTVAALTQRWAQAAISQGPCSTRYTNLDIGDHLGQRLLRLTLTEDSDWTHFSTRRVRQWARPDTRLVVLDSAALRRGLDQLQGRNSSDTGGTLHDCWYDAARDRLPGRPVDASLLVPLLETLSDQVCPLRILIGNRGLLQSYDIALFDFRLQATLLRLRSSVAELELDLERITAARVVCAARPAAAPWLRLYDDQTHCVASLSLGAGADGTDRELWKVLLRALSD